MKNKASLLNIIVAVITSLITLVTALLSLIFGIASIVEFKYIELAMLVFTLLIIYTTYNISKPAYEILEQHITKKVKTTKLIKNYIQLNKISNRFINGIIILICVDNYSVEFALVILILSLLYKLLLYKSTKYNVLVLKENKQNAES